MARTQLKFNKPLSKGGAAVCVFCLFLGFLAFFSAKWFVDTYGQIGFDSILFTLTSGVEDTSADLIIHYLLGGLLPAAASTVGAALLLFFPYDRFFRKFSISGIAAVLVTVILCVALIITAAIFVELDEYVWDLIWKSTLYETAYVDPDTVEITFPEEKRNLVYIIMESMEVSYLSQELGGALEYNLVPELYQLALDNTNFSSTDGVGGFHATNGASWTIASLVAQTAGIPLKTPSGNQNDYGSDGEKFLPGVTSLTNILEDAGYHTSFMCGSNASFGGRREYFIQHGIDKVYDLYTARRAGIVESDYFVWWGMEDLYLYEYAQQELTSIAAKSEPFAFTMLTVDTHHIDGYQCEYCTDSYEEPYEQSISCASRQVMSFLQWIQEQDFYENTTIVITGDHLSMDNGYFERNVSEDYERMVYNVIINAPVQTTNTKNRDYCAVDLFPTTLAALGCTIEGDRLGLGTNLFSDLPTLAEKLGFDRFNEELSKSSDYYTNHFYNAK